VDDGVSALRLPQFLQQREHAIEVKLCPGKFGDMFETIIDERIEVIKGLIVGGFDVSHVRE
jgi:hypothetical protein